MNDRPRPKTQIEIPLRSSHHGGDDVLGRANPTVFNPLHASVAGHATRPKTQIDAATADRPLYSPRRRPPTARLDVLDDGSTTSGQIIRIRKDEFTIGRKDGDLVIEHDLDMSARHAVVKRLTEKGQQRWVLQDLGSTNGTFIRVARAPLADGSEVLLGEDRYKIEIDHSPSTTEDVSAQNGATRMYQVVAKPSVAVLTLRLKSIGDTSRQYAIDGRGATIGADQHKCEIAIADDFLSVVHARIAYSGDKWLIEDLGSLNGVWLSIRQVCLEKSAEFQLGEQRFRFQAEVRNPT